jgi:dihydrofolate synthase/folylpolyglutamate synthase
VIAPVLSVITNIGWDHMDILGDTLEKIATEKAGIIKPKTPVVVSEREEETENIFEQKALIEDSEIHFASDHYRVVDHAEMPAVDVFKNDRLALEKISLPLQGIYQKKNIAGVLQSVEILRRLGWEISDDDLLSGLHHVISQTGLKGRWQVLGKDPLVVCDTGHNLNGIKEVLRQIQQQSYRKLIMVFGMVKGKDADNILKLLPKDAYYFFCQAKIPRALDAAILFEQAQQHQLTGEVIADINEAIYHAKQKATTTDMIFIGGSTFVVAEIENL